MYASAELMRSIVSAVGCKLTVLSGLRSLVELQRILLVVDTEERPAVRSVHVYKGSCGTIRSDPDERDLASL